MTTTAHPLQLWVRPPARWERIHVAIRLVLLLALGAIGYSSIYWVLYLAVPAGVALLVASRGAERYLRGDGPRVVRALAWLAGAYGYLWLLTDAPPGSGDKRCAELTVELEGNPTPRSALIRLLYSLPALVLLAVLSLCSWLLWVVGAFAILFARRLPRPIAEVLEVILVFQLRLFAYHLSLVDRYPSFERASLPELERRSPWHKMESRDAT